MTPDAAMLTLRDAQLARLQAEVREARAEARHWRNAWRGLWLLYGSTRSERDALAAQLDCAIARNVARVCDEGQPGGAA